jgi:hypothetical protein
MVVQMVQIDFKKVFEIGGTNGTRNWEERRVYSWA